MADFFSNLARQVLGAAPEVGPLLPPRFAPWSGLPAVDGPTWPPEAFEAPARADAPLFPPPLIDPDGPAANAPLPTFRQMSELKSASGPSGQPGQMPVAQDRPGTPDSEQGDVRQDVTTLVRPAVDDTPPHVPPDAPASTPTSSAIQIETDSDTDNALTASPAPRCTPGDRPAEETATMEPDLAVPHPSSLTPASTLQPAPRPAAGQERSAYSAGLPDSPADVRRLPRSGQAEPVKTDPLEMELIEAKRPKPVETRPELLKARPEPTSAPLTVQPAAFVPAPVTQRRAVPGDQPAETLVAQPVPATDPDLPVSTQAKATSAITQTVLAATSPEPASPDRRAAAGSREPVVPVVEPVAWEMGSATHAEAEPVEVQPLARTPASVPHVVEPAASVPAPVTQRQAVPGDQPVAPLESRPVPAAELDLPVSTQGRVTAATPVSDLTTGSLEPAPPAGRAVPGWREPVIVPAPEPAPGEMGSPTLAEGKVSLRPPSARPTTGAPEPATTVRVTIGRVVVRASPAAERPPSRRVELPRPPLALEEYLRGRQGDER